MWGIITVVIFEEEGAVTERGYKGASGLGLDLGVLKQVSWFTL